MASTRATILLPLLCYIVLKNPYTVTDKYCGFLYYDNMQSARQVQIFCKIILPPSVACKSFHYHTHTYNTLEPHVTRSFRNLETGSQMLQKKVLHTVQSSASSFNFQYPLSSLMSFISCLWFLPHLPITSDPSQYLSFNNAFWKAGPTQDVTKTAFFLLLEGYSSPPWFFVEIPLEGSQVIPILNFTSLLQTFFNNYIIQFCS
jgi:hypothetical protein